MARAKWSKWIGPSDIDQAAAGYPSPKPTADVPPQHEKKKQCRKHQIPVQRARVSETKPPESPMVPMNAMSTSRAIHLENTRPPVSSLVPSPKRKACSEAILQPVSATLSPTFVLYDGPPKFGPRDRRDFKGSKEKRESDKARQAAHRRKKKRREKAAAEALQSSAAIDSPVIHQTQPIADQPAEVLPQKQDTEKQDRKVEKRTRQRKRKRARSDVSISADDSFRVENLRKVATCPAEDVQDGYPARELEVSEETLDALSFGKPFQTHGRKEPSDLEDELPQPQPQTQDRSSLSDIQSRISTLDFLESTNIQVKTAYRASKCSLSSLGRKATLALASHLDFSPELKDAIERTRQLFLVCEETIIMLYDCFTETFPSSPLAASDEEYVAIKEMGEVISRTVLECWKQILGVCEQVVGCLQQEGPCGIKDVKRAVSQLGCDAVALIETCVRLDRIGRMPEDENTVMLKTGP
ncbi:hypothetical protein BJ508DRAFT_416365 [Ascobolus immersus RN42]|uniref:Uncharacterized protein n=1 Tax=Ascobolus immersus RN42 TaxID=1160509 RepID=A0A3N4HY37_ASCIM|nr:hypothetical protein BJ508DRAFT_416365 [Ascobolus immersus RN42]